MGGMRGESTFFLRFGIRDPQSVCAEEAGVDVAAGSHADELLVLIFFGLWQNRM